MKIKFDQLKLHLNKNFSSIYFVHGDEYLQRQEACDLIRSRASEKNYTSRDVLHFSASFDWQSFLEKTNSLSLFSEKRIIELRNFSGKPGDRGAKALIEYCQRPPDDCLVLIVSEKLEAQSQRSKWYKALENAGVILQVWPIDQRHLPRWIEQRLQSRGLKADKEAVNLLVDRLEGNMLAAAQEIEKLALLKQGDVISVEDVNEAVSSHARFDIFKLVDAAMGGQVVRFTRILTGLRQEKVEPIIILWAIGKEIRNLCNMAIDIDQGNSTETVLSTYRVWEQRKPLIRQGLNRYSGHQWQQVLRRVSRIDRMIKGIMTGNVWDELLQLCLLMAGVRLFTKPLVAQVNQ